MFAYRWIVIAALSPAISVGADESMSQGPTPIAFADPIPYGQRPIDYLGPATVDAASKLNRRLESGDVKIEHSKRNGYLRSLLDELGVPVESQLLVFSKTALNPNLVTPRNPRAIYFRDDVYVGWVPGAESIEVAAIDPVKGAVFYTLSQNADRPPRLVREERCTACHAGQATLQIPGTMVRSFLTDETGKPTAGYSTVTHESPFSNRLGGWYVTGTHGEQPHMGNLFGRDAHDRLKSEPLARGNVPFLKEWLDVAQHESPHSDLVAHLVLQHQSHGQNLMIRVGQESRLGRRSDAEDRLIRYLVFADEAPLTSEVRGTSEFREMFEKRGPADARGRTLRTFDLRTRLFAYRLSYLIETEAFQRLPDDVKSRLYERIWRVLHATEPKPENGTWPAYPSMERDAIIGILRETHRDLPPVWNAASR